MRARDLDRVLRKAAVGSCRVRIAFRPDAGRTNTDYLISAFACDIVYAKQRDLVRLCMDVFVGNWKADGYTLVIDLPASFDNKTARDEFVAQMSRALKSAEVVSE